MGQSERTAKKITLGVQAGYGIGQAGDTIPYCMFYTFFLYYLTDVAGVSPTMAGTISLIAVIWDGITDPVVGYLSDKCRSKYGRRRPFMIVSAVPLTLTVFLIFAPLPLTGGIKNVYYIIMAALFWTCYTVYVIPYMSLAADITSDYNGRNNIRMFNMLFGGCFMLLCTSGPMLVLDKALSMGYSEGFSWGVSGAVFGLIALVCCLISWFAMRGKENPQLAPVKTEKKESIFKVIKESFSIRAYRQLIFMTVLMMLGQIIATSAFVYLLYDRLGLSEVKQSQYWLLYAIMYIILVRVSSRLANRKEKKRLFLFAIPSPEHPCCFSGFMVSTAIRGF